MKTTVRFLLLSLAIALSACGNDLDNEGIKDNNQIEMEGIIVSNNQIQSPKWLIHVIDSMASTRVPGANGTKLYPWVYTIEHNSQTYPTNTYWLDGSYISATSGSATKVSYLSDNHSAVTTGS